MFAIYGWSWNYEEITGCFETREEAENELRENGKDRLCEQTYGEEGFEPVEVTAGNGFICWPAYFSVENGKVRDRMAGDF